MELTSQIEETEKQHAESLKQFEDRLSTIMPHYNHLKVSESMQAHQDQSLCSRNTGVVNTFVVGVIQGRAHLLNFVSKDMQ